MRGRRPPLGALLRIFGEDYGTAQVLNTPTETDRKVANTLIANVSSDAILRDLAITCAREVSNVLEQHGMRPADYADIPDLAKKMQIVIGRALSSENGKSLFETKLREYVRLRG